MQPIYFNPLTPTASNYIGSNPLDTFTTEPTYMEPAYFNPSLYQSFTFDQFPSLSFVIAPMLITSSTSYVSATTYTANDVSTIEVNSFATKVQFYEYNSTIFYSTLAQYDITYSTFYTHFASSAQVQPIAFSQRFGTEKQLVYASEVAATDVFSTYQSSFSQGVFNSTNIIYSTLVTETLVSGVWTTTFSSSGLYNIYETQGTIFTGSTTLLHETTFYRSDGVHVVGSSMFVEMMGSNVYTGLLVTTDSVIVYQNEQISSYYSESLSYQVNIANLTAALNSVSTTDCEEGQCDITVTTFSWVWYTTEGGWSGSQYTDFTGYLSTQSVNYYLSENYGGTIITTSTNAVTQVQSLITVQNNDLSNSQTFLNNAVTTLQSQVSLAGQIISSLSSSTQSIISNI